MLSGTIMVICDQWPVFKKHGPSSLSQVLENSAFVLLLSAGWAVILVEGTNMFVESWLKQRRQEGRQEGRQEILDKLLRIAEHKTLTKQDLYDLRDGSLDVSTKEEETIAS